jgi:D-3-phosphoglycerate dehydrogenase
LVNSKRMKMMPGKRGAIKCGNHIVNCARGGIVDEDALLSALEDGTVTSAALDVFEVEPLPKDYSLTRHENFHGTPHIGAATLEAQQRVGIDIADAVITGLTGKKPKTLVNGTFL